MSSSTSSSECHSGSGPGAPRVLPAGAFVVAVLLIAAGLLVGLEAYVRADRAMFHTPGEDGAYVRRVLERPDANVIIGDSHLLPVGGPDGWINLSRPGLAAAEEARVLAARLKFFGIDRVVIESGPQILMAARQGDFRSLPPQTLARQVFPEPVLILEPSILGAAARAVLGWLPAPVSAAKAAEGGDRARKKRGETKETQSADQVRARVMLQRPVEDYEASSAWARHWDIVGRLAEAGVEVCLVQTPVAPVYLRTARRLKGVRYFPALEALMKEAGRRDIRYVAAAELKSDYPETLFANADHLNRRGGAAFWREVSGLCFDTD